MADPKTPEATKPETTPEETTVEDTTAEETSTEATTTDDTTETPAEGTEEPQKNDKRKWIIILILAIVVITFILLLINRANQGTVEYTTVSGTIRYTGVIPAEPVQGSVVVVARDVNTSEEFEVVNDDIPLTRDAEWSWSTATPGVTYEIKAYVEYEDDNILDSSNVVATAPALDQHLVFIVTEQVLVDNGIAISTDEAENNATIQATFNLSGYVPEGSTVTILGKLSEDINYTVAKSGIPAVSGTSMTWNAAEVGAFYDFYGVLFDASGNKIGQSDVIRVAAPSSGNSINIASTATPPAPVKATISGTIQLNGLVELGSTIVMRQKITTDSTYVDFQTISAANGVSWFWNDANSGSAYDITAVILVNGSEDASGSVVTTTAPAANMIVTIDTGIQMPVPTIAPTISCGEVVDNQVQATIEIPVIEDAAQYFVEAGTSPRAGDVLYQRTQELQSQVMVAPNTLYYAGYAYSYNSMCSNAECFSGLSPEATFQCESEELPPVVVDPTCSVNYNVREEWETGFTVDITIKNNTAEQIDGWRLAWAFAGNQEITSMWNGDYAQDGSTVVVANATYNSEIEPDSGIVQIGFVGSYTGENVLPTEFSLNGEVCDVF